MKIDQAFNHHGIAGKTKDYLGMYKYFNQANCIAYFYWKEVFSSTLHVIYTILKIHQGSNTPDSYIYSKSS